MIILDTDAVTFLEHQNNEVSEKLRGRLTDLSGEEEVATTVISYEEQIRGWCAVLAKAHDTDKQIRAYDRLLKHLETYRDIDVLPYTAAAGRCFAELRVKKVRIGTMDLKIAAIALSLNATLFSRSLADFQQVPGLKVEDWTLLT